MTDAELLEAMTEAVLPFVAASLYGVATYEAVRAANLRQRGLSDYETCYVGAGVHAAESRVSYSDWQRLSRLAIAIEARRAETPKSGSVEDESAAIAQTQSGITND